MRGKKRTLSPDVAATVTAIEGWIGPPLAGGCPTSAPIIIVFLSSCCQPMWSRFASGAHDILRDVNLMRDTAELW